MVLGDLSKTLLTAEEEISLAWRMRGDNIADAIAARNELVLRNLGLVGKATRWYLRRVGGDWDDIFAEGTLGLIAAADGYDPAWHRRFAAYAQPAIFHTIRTYVMEAGMIRVPRYLHGRQAAERRDHSPSKSRRRAATTARNIALAHAALTPACSLSQAGSVGSPAHDPADTRPAPLDRLIVMDDVADLNCALAELPALQAYIIMHRHGLCDAPVRTLGELGAEFDRTGEWVRQVENQAMLGLAVAIRRQHR